MARIIALTLTFAMMPHVWCDHLSHMSARPSIPICVGGQGCFKIKNCNWTLLLIQRVAQYLVMAWTATVTLYGEIWGSIRLCIYSLPFKASDQTKIGLIGCLYKLLEKPKVTKSLLLPAFWHHKGEGTTSVSFTLHQMRPVAHVTRLLNGVGEPGKARGRFTGAKNLSLL